MKKILLVFALLSATGSFASDNKDSQLSTTSVQQKKSSSYFYRLMKYCTLGGVFAGVLSSISKPVARTAYGYLYCVAGAPEIVADMAAESIKIGTQLGIFGAVIGYCICPINETKIDENAVQQASA